MDNSKYLEVKLDGALIYKKHCEDTGKKVATRNNILHKLARSTWGTSADTLRITALSLVYSVAEHCAPVWLNTSLVDVQLNETMRIISETIKSTLLYILASGSKPH